MSDAAQRVPFDDLPPAVRKRFIACAEGREDPRPIAFETHETRAGSYAILSVAAGALLVGLLAYAWGIDPEADHLESGQWVTAKYAVVAFAFAAATFAALSARARRSSLPWPTGIYMFPAAFIDATRAELRVVSIARIRAAADVVFSRSNRRRRGGSLITNLELDDGTTETLSRNSGEERLTTKRIKHLKRDLEKAIQSGDEAEIAKLDPLAHVEAEIDVGGGYRSVARKKADGPTAGRMSRWLAHPVPLAALTGLALSAGLGLYVLPALAVSKALAAHSPEAVRRAAIAWPYAWVERATGFRLRSVDEVSQNVESRMRDPEAARVLIQFLRDSKRLNNPIVASYVELAKSPIDLVRITPIQSRSVGVALERALDLPREVFEMSARGPIPKSPDPRSVTFRCSVAELPRTYPAGGLEYHAFSLACEAWLVSGGATDRIATVTVEPSLALDLTKIVMPEVEADDDGVVKKATTSAAVDTAMYSAMMDSAIEALSPAFERAIVK